MSAGAESLMSTGGPQSPPETDYVISVQGVVKRFGDVTALDGIDLAVRPGTVVGLLGPNGAGKTTRVRVLATLPDADPGRGRRRSVVATWAPTRTGCGR